MLIHYNVYSIANFRCLGIPMTTTLGDDLRTEPSHRDNVFEFALPSFIENALVNVGSPKRDKQTSRLDGLPPPMFTLDSDNANSSVTENRVANDWYGECGFVLSFDPRPSSLPQNSSDAMPTSQHHGAAHHIFKSDHIFESVF